MYIKGIIIRDRIAHELKSMLVGREKPLTLAILIVGKNPVIEGFVAIKKRFADEIGVQVIEKRFPEDVTQEMLLAILNQCAENKDISGIVVQLPLPPHIDTQTILDHIPREKDVDVLSASAVDAFMQGRSMILPPVAGAIREILKETRVVLSGAHALVVGRGRLVGAPVAAWLVREGALVETADRNTTNLATRAQNALIIVTGVGVPSIITTDMITPDTILIDAGTSESSGRIVGDSEHAALEKARFATPVPGGVGPATVAILFQNLAHLAGMMGRS